MTTQRRLFENDQSAELKLSYWQNLALPNSTLTSEDYLINLQRMNGWGARVWGFKRAADILVDHYPNESISSYDIVFPIMHAYCHYIELELKLILMHANHLTEINRKIFNEHNLEKLWSELKNGLQTIFSGEPQTTFESIQCVIDPFLPIPYSELTRYNINKDGNEIIQEGFDKVLNLLEVKNRIAQLDDIFDHIGKRLCEIIDPRLKYPYSLLRNVSDSNESL